MLSMKITNVLAGLLGGSATCLAVGDLFLYGENLVPAILVAITAIAVIVLVPLSVLVYRRNLVAVDVSTILGIVAPLISLSTPSHVAVLLSFGENLLLSVLGALQFFGFYLFPISYVIVRLAYRKRIQDLTSRMESRTKTDANRN